MRNGIDGRTGLTGANIVKESGQASRYSVSNSRIIVTSWKALGKQQASPLSSNCIVFKIIDFFYSFRLMYRNIFRQIWETGTVPPIHKLYEYGKMEGYLCFSRW
jgi:hypothetical protein